MSKKLFLGLTAISAGLLIAVIVMAWTNPTANPPGGSGAGFFPSGTSIVFFQASCPSGWTQNTSYNDRVMMITSGAGGGQGGSWAISGLSSANGGVDHTHGTPNHSHNLAEIAETQYFQDGIVTFGAAVYRDGNDLKLVSTSMGNPATIYRLKVYTNTSGSGTTGGASATQHTHTISQDGGWRPSYLNAIICVKS